MMKVLVCGGRDYADRTTVSNSLGSFNAEYGPIIVIQGGAKGADDLAGQWAKYNELPVVTHYAPWKRLGRAAGQIRNGEMLAVWSPDYVIAFPGGRGTTGMVKRAMDVGTPVWQVGG